jgi:hypothetical protein
MELNASLSYNLVDIDPYVDSERSEPLRLQALKPILRMFAKSVDKPQLVDASSNESFGACLSSPQNSELGSIVLDAIFGDDPNVRICLIRPTFTILSPQEADELSECERLKCVAIRGDINVAMPKDDIPNITPHVVLTIPSSIFGGTRDAKMTFELSSRDVVKVSIVSSSGSRKYMTSGTLPEILLKRLFEVSCGAGKAPLGPTRSHVLSQHSQAAIVDFLERKLRLQVLCTAAMPSPISRPVVVDSVTLRPLFKKNTSWASVRVVLHPSSSACICGAHGLRIDGVNRVEVNLETCGRMLQPLSGGTLACPCHRNAVHSIDAHCTQNTTINVRCLHTNGGVTRAKSRIDNVHLNNADRFELSSIIINALEFEALTRIDFNSKGAATNQPEIDRHAATVGNKLLQRLSVAQCAQAEKEDSEETTTCGMLQRDMVAVDLMRGGGVFLHVRKSGTNKHQPYLNRAQRTDKTPKLLPHEEELVTTHGHLFRKAT